MIYPERPPSARVTPHSVGRCREAIEGSGRVSGPAKRVGERLYPKCNYGDAAPPVGAGAQTPPSQREAERND